MSLTYMGTATKTQGCAISVVDNNIKINGGGPWVGREFQKILSKVTDRIDIQSIPSDKTLHVGYAKQVDGELLLHILPEVRMRYGVN